MIRLASDGLKTARNTKNELSLSLSVSQTRFRLRTNGNLRYLKAHAAPSLTANHHENRLRWARTHVRWTTADRGKVLFSDKKCCLDGPDGIRSYWHDLRKEPKLLVSRQKGGGRVMIWSAFSLHGCYDVFLMRGRQKSEAYLTIMEDFMLPFGDEKLPVGRTYQQDNDSLHTRHAVMK